MIDLGQAVGASAKYWVTVHDGHGTDLRGSAPGKNILTNAFLNDIVGTNITMTGCPIVGTGTATPAATDTTLADYAGKCDSVEIVAGSYSYDDTPNADGYVMLRQTYVAHYLPGRLGATPLNLAEAGVSTANISSTTVSTSIYSRGRLVDGSGMPTTVSYDPATEYLDVYWELTLWFKAEVSGTVSFNILGTPTSHTYVAKIANWRQQAGDSNSLWRLPGVTVNGINFVASTMRVNYSGGASPQIGCYACSGPIGTIAQLPTATGGLSHCSTVTAAVATTTGQREWTIQWGPEQGNISGGIGAFFVSTGTYGPSGASGSGGPYGSSWQIEVSPKVDKTSLRYFNLNVRMSAGNYTP